MKFRSSMHELLHSIRVIAESAGENTNKEKVTVISKQ